ncbi:unnamed protein product, partial [Gadus morhua 'NCC']
MVGICVDEIDDESRGRLLILDDSGFEEFVDDTGDGEFPSSFQLSQKDVGRQSKREGRDGYEALALSQIHTGYLRSWLDCTPRNAESVPGLGQPGQVKLEPLLGHLGGEMPPKISGQHPHEAATYILEPSPVTREMSHLPAAIPGTGFEENKDICEGSEDKDGPDQ